MPRWHIFLCLFRRIVYAPSQHLSMIFKFFSMPLVLYLYVTCMFHSIRDAYIYLSFVCNKIYPPSIYLQYYANVFFYTPLMYIYLRTIVCIVHIIVYTFIPSLHVGLYVMQVYYHTLLTSQILLYLRKYLHVITTILYKQYSVINSTNCIVLIST